MGYSKAPEQPQSSARPIYHFHAMTRTGCEPATIHIAAYRSSQRYALRHGRRLFFLTLWNRCRVNTIKNMFILLKNVKGQ